MSTGALEIAREDVQRQERGLPSFARSHEKAKQLLGFVEIPLGHLPLRDTDARLRQLRIEVERGLI